MKFREGEKLTLIIEPDWRSAHVHGDCGRLWQVNVPPEKLRDWVREQKRMGVLRSIKKEESAREIVRESGTGNESGGTIEDEIDWGEIEACDPEEEIIEE